MKPIISPDGKVIINPEKICYVEFGCADYRGDFCFKMEHGGALYFKLDDDWRKILNELSVNLNVGD